MEVKIKHTKIEMQLALVGLERKFKDVDGEFARLEKILSNAVKLPETQKEINASAAEYNGVSIEGLIASPNYEKLVDQYKASLIDNVIEILKNEGGLSDCEAWALCALSTGLIK